MNMSDVKYFKICVLCNDKIFYKTKESYWANKNKVTPCRKCNGAAHSKRMSGRERPEFSEQWKQNMADAHKKSNIWKLSMNTPEYKKNIERKCYV